MEESIQGMVRQGKILNIGLSDTPAWQASRMQAIAELRGWRDEANEVLVRRLKENGLTADAGVDTMFDYIEVDEGRPARKAAL